MDEKLRTDSCTICLLMAINIWHCIINESFNGVKQMALTRCIPMTLINIGAVCLQAPHQGFTPGNPPPIPSGSRKAWRTDSYTMGREEGTGTEGTRQTGYSHPRKLTYFHLLWQGPCTHLYCKNTHTNVSIYQNNRTNVFLV